MANGSGAKLFSIPGFKLKYISIDQLHAGDLGVMQFILGNILFDIFVEIGGLLTNPDSALSDIDTWIRLASRQCGMMQPPIGELTLGMVKPQGHVETELLEKWRL